MSHDSFRITWNEYSPSHSPCSVIAELHAGEWLFFDQLEGEVRWYPRLTSPMLVATAEEERIRKLRTEEDALREVA